MTEKLVIIGNGMAPGRMLEHLFEPAPGRYEVTIFNAEPRVNYDRIMLSPVLSGEKAFEEIVIHGDGWYIEHGITLYKGHKIVGDRPRGEDRHLRPRRRPNPTTSWSSPPARCRSSSRCPGNDLPGVLTYRDLDDVNAMLLAAQSRGQGGGHRRRPARARGGGRACKQRGMDVTVLHVMPTLMERQLDPAAGYLLQKAVEARGIKVITKANTKAIVGDGKVEGVELADGTIIPADLVVMAVGIRPNVGARQGRRPRGQSRHRRRRPACAPPIPTSSRSANAPRSAARSTASSRRSTRWRSVAAAQLAGDETAAFVHSRHADQAEGHRHRPLLARRLRRRRRPRGDRAARRRRRRLQAPRPARTTASSAPCSTARPRDGAWFNDLKKKQTDISRDARHADLRPGLPGRVPAGPYGGRCSLAG